MTVHNSQEEKQLLTLLARMAVPEEDRLIWMENIHTNGLSESLAEEIHQKLNAPAENESEADRARRTRNLLDFTRILRQWRLTRQSRNFTKR